MPNKLFSVNKIVSGGQTGVDRAAWDFALANGIAIGGYVPKERLAEDGTIDAKYGPTIETDSRDPGIRTELNVLNSDATLIIYRGELFGGTELTREIAIAANKPHLSIDLGKLSNDDINEAKAWLDHAAAGLLNIAGPRESDRPGIYRETLELLEKVLIR